MNKFNVGDQVWAYHVVQKDIPSIGTITIITTKQTIYVKYEHLSYDVYYDNGFHHLLNYYSKYRIENYLK